MDSNYTSRPEKLDSGNLKDDVKVNLVLHNDEVNTFDYVMEALVQVCNHSQVQAEQCTLITHYKGKCDVKSGTYKEMKEMRYQLILKGLKATIDKL